MMLTKLIMRGGLNRGHLKHIDENGSARGLRRGAAAGGRHDHAAAAGGPAAGPASSAPGGRGCASRCSNCNDVARAVRSQMQRALPSLLPAPRPSTRTPTARA